MITLAELVVKLLADAEGYSKTFDAAEEKASGLGSHIGGIAGTIGKVLGGALITGGAALLGGLTASVAAAAEAEQGVAQLEAVLRSTGGAVGMTKDELLGLASGLQDVTRFEDDAVLQAENMLLTFTNIGKNVFPDATKTALDMSQALGQDLKSSSIQLGKALNDPIAGITALSRVGVTFTDVQKDQIKAMVESGDVMGAQKTILAELNREFGGSAEAAGKTWAGKWDIFKNKIGDVAESIGGRLLPLLSPLQDKLIGVVDNVAPMIQNIIDQVVPTIIDGLGQVVTWVEARWAPIRDVILGVWASVTAWIDANVVPVFNRVVAWVVATWPLVRDTITKVFWDTVAWVQANVVPFITDTLVPAFWSVVDFVTTNYPIVRDAIVNAFWSAVGWMQANIVPFVTDTLLPAFWSVVAWVQENWPKVRDTVIDTFWAVVQWVQANIVPFFTGVVLPAFTKVWEWITTNWPMVRDTVVKTFWDVVEWVKNNILPMFSPGGTVTTAFGGAVQWFKDTWTTVSGIVNTVWATITKYFENYVQPFLQTYVIPAIMAVVTWVEKWVPKVQEIFLAVFEEIKKIYFAVLQPVLEFLLAQVMKVVNWFGENWPLIQKTVETVVGAIVKVVGWLFSELSKIFTGDGNGTVSVFKAIFGKIGDFVGSTVDFVLALLKALMQVITGDFMGAAQTMNKGLADLLWAGLNLWTMILDTLINVVRNAMVKVLDLIGGKGFSKDLAVMLGIDLNKGSDILGSLGITKDSIYSALNVNAAPTTDPKTNVINGMGTNGNTIIVNVATKDDPNAVAQATAQELRWQQVAAYAP